MSNNQTNKRIPTAESSRVLISESSTALIAKVLSGLLNHKNNWLDIDPETLNLWNYKKAAYLIDEYLLSGTTLQRTLPIDIYKPDISPPQGQKYDIVFTTGVWETATEFLSPEGLLIYFAINFHSLQNSFKSGYFENLGFYPASVMELPKGILRPGYPSRPLLVCLKKGAGKYLTHFLELKTYEAGDNIENFVYGHLGEELTPEDYDKYCRVGVKDTNYLLETIYENRFFDESSLSSGIHESLEFFPGFDFWRFLSPQEPENTDFKTYPKCRIRDLVATTNLTRGEFEENDLAVYVPLIGTQQVLCNALESRIKHQNMCQIIVNPELINADYLKVYLNSKFGKLFRDAATAKKNGTIRRLNRRDVLDLPVSLPPLDQQSEIVSVAEKIDTAVKGLEGIRDSLGLNPVSSKNELYKLDSMLRSLSAVSPLLREESVTHEFKASFRTPYPEMPKPTVNEKGQTEYVLGNTSFSSIKKVQSFLESIVVKSVAAFLNTKGGTLVIGVHEKGNQKKVVGIEREKFDSNDHYERHLVQILKNNLGTQIVAKFITTQVDEIDGKAVCIITCDAASNEVIVVDEKVYVRTGPRVDELTTAQVIQFSKSRDISRV